MSEEKKLEILFVDDEERLLDGLRRRFRPHREQWSMRFALSGAEALKMLEETPATVVVSDMRMPGMDGATLLTEIRKRWPSTVRFILSGQTDQEELLASVGAIHQFLQKPCEPETIIHSISRAHSLAALIERTDLRRIVGGVESLPVLSTTYQKLVQAIEDEDADAESVAAVVMGDVGLSTKLLQMINSAFFGLPRRVTSVKDAIVLIGIDRLRVIAITSQVFDALAATDEVGETISRLWSLSTDIGAAAAKAAADNGGSEAERESARLAGTLSLVGRALLARMMPDRFRNALEHASLSDLELSDTERAEFGVAQHTIGAYALGLWAFDDAIVEAIARQAAPSSSVLAGPDHPLRYVHEARSRGYGDALADPLPRDDEWIAQLQQRKEAA